MSDQTTIDANAHHRLNSPTTVFLTLIPSAAFCRTPHALHSSTQYEFCKHVHIGRHIPVQNTLHRHTPHIHTRHGDKPILPRILCANSICRSALRNVSPVCVLTLGRGALALWRWQWASGSGCVCPLCRMCDGYNMRLLDQQRRRRAYLHASYSTRTRHKIHIWPTDLLACVYGFFCHRATHLQMLSQRWWMFEHRQTRQTQTHTRRQLVPRDVGGPGDHRDATIPRCRDWAHRSVYRCTLVRFRRASNAPKIWNAHMHMACTHVAPRVMCVRLPNIYTSGKSDFGIRSSSFLLVPELCVCYEMRAVVQHTIDWHNTRSLNRTRGVKRLLVGFLFLAIRLSLRPSRYTNRVHMRKQAYNARNLHAYCTEHRKEDVTCMRETATSERVEEKWTSEWRKGVRKYALDYTRDLYLNMRVDSGPVMLVGGLQTLLEQSIQIRTCRVSAHVLRYVLVFRSHCFIWTMDIQIFDGCLTRPRTRTLFFFCCSRRLSNHSLSY